MEDEIDPELKKLIGMVEGKGGDTINNHQDLMMQQQQQQAGPSSWEDSSIETALILLDMKHNTAWADVGTIYTRLNGDKLSLALPHELLHMPNVLEQYKLKIQKRFLVRRCFQAGLEVAECQRAIKATHGEDYLFKPGCVYQLYRRFRAGDYSLEDKPRGGYRGGGGGSSGKYPSVENKLKDQPETQEPVNVVIENPTDPDKSSKPNKRPRISKKPDPETGQPQPNKRGSARSQFLEAILNPAPGSIQATPSPKYCHSVKTENQVVVKKRRNNLQFGLNKDGNPIWIDSNVRLAEGKRFKSAQPSGSGFIQIKASTSGLATTTDHSYIPIPEKPAAAPKRSNISPVSMSAILPAPKPEVKPAKIKRRWNSDPTPKRAFPPEVCTDPEHVDSPPKAKMLETSGFVAWFRVGQPATLKKI